MTPAFANALWWLAFVGLIGSAAALAGLLISLAIGLFKDYSDHE